MPSTPRSFALVAVIVGACDSQEARFAFVDQPSPSPPQVELAEQPAIALNDEDARATCTRGSGRDAQGVCRRLRTNDLGYVERVQLPAGTFMMGDAPFDYDAAPARKDLQMRWDGQPPRLEEGHAFWIDLHEVTRTAYEECVRADKCTPAFCSNQSDATEAFVSDTPELMPQTCVTHAQAQAFCEAHGGRLPTEIEWEYAARGLDARIYPWGNQVDDQLLQGLGPVTSPATDISYFGIRGMGINALEWVAETYEADAALARWITRPFRSPKGPYWRSTNKDRTTHVIKGGRVGARRKGVGADTLVGFRCAADLEPDETPLAAPLEPPNVPAMRKAEQWWVFGAVAEVVDRREAQAFCAALRLEEEGRVYDAWRLPTADEVRALAQLFRGPGPFWTTDGAVVQTTDGVRAQPTDPWVEETARADEALAARCVHDD